MEINYTNETNPNEALEVTIQTAREIMVLCAWRGETGVVGYSLTNGTSGQSLSISNLQLTLPYPRKAVAGWQTEFVASLRSGLGKIAEVR